MQEAVDKKIYSPRPTRGKKNARPYLKNKRKKKKKSSNGRAAA
jgi:hypothetical protein